VGFGNGLYRRSEEKWVKVALPDALAGCDFASALTAGPEGSVWAAVTSGSRPELGGVVQFRGEEALAYTPANSPLPSARIRDLLVTRAGEVWFASDIGVARLDRASQWHVFTSVNSGLGCNVVLGLAEDPEGRLWLATARGVSCFSQDGKVKERSGNGPS
jgi:ligand-binding sensor domain-containing protein